MKGSESENRLQGTHFFRISRLSNIDHATPQNLCLLSVFLLLVSAISAEAKTIPAFRMDSLFLQSQVVVYCEETDVQTKEIEHGNSPNSPDAVSWKEVVTLTKCKVLQTFKGDLKPGTELEIDYSGLFRRYLYSKGPYDELDGAKRIVSVHEAEYFPRGRVLLFLHQNASKYEVVGAKLVQGGKVYQFIQLMNPGPLNLARQRQENIKLSKNEEYGEEELLHDAAIALRRSAFLKKPIPVNPIELISSERDLE